MKNNDQLPNHMAALVKDLASDDVEVRKVAAIKLSELRDPRVLDFIQDKQDDPDELVRYFLVKAVKETVRDKQVREAVRFFGKGDPSLDQPSLHTSASRPRPSLPRQDNIFRPETVSETRRFPWYAHLFFILSFITIAVLIPRQQEPEPASTGPDTGQEAGSDSQTGMSYTMPDPRQVFQLAEEGLQYVKDGMEPEAVNQLSAAADLLREMKQNAAPEELPKKFYFYYYACLSKGGRDMKIARELIHHLERFYQRSRDDILLERALVNLIGYYFSKTLEEKKLSGKLVSYVREYRRKFPMGSAREDVESITAHLIEIGAVKLEEL